jgi:hypothetical protein
VLALQGCAGAARARVERAEAVAAASRLRDVLGLERERVLAAAARAPSTHNSQPWRVRILEPDEWTVEPDTSRRLPAVDPADRELALSLGAFLEYLVVAASALGFDARVEDARGGDVRPGVSRVRLSSAPPDTRAVAQLRCIAQRRTLRKGYSSAPIAKDDLATLTQALGARAEWFPRGTRGADWLRDVAVRSFEQQTGREPAQQELARWVRFSDADATKSADGLTADTMEVGGLAGFYMRHFMDAESVTAKSFRDRGVDAVRAQAGEGAGWLVLGAPDESWGSLLEAGRVVARMALLLRERRLAAHPMSQVLEETPWRADVARALGVGSPQFVLRVGYVASYPEPVSLRRPASAFASLD